MQLSKTHYGESCMLHERHQFQHIASHADKLTPWTAALPERLGAALQGLLVLPRPLQRMPRQHHIALNAVQQDMHAAHLLSGLMMHTTLQDAAFGSYMPWATNPSFRKIYSLQEGSMLSS